MLKQPIPIEKSNLHPQFRLKQQNLIPIYVLQDNMKSNFSQIQFFIDKQSSHNSTIESNLTQTNQTLKKLDQKYTTQLKDMEKSIFSKIKTEIQATVTLVLNKQLATILDKILENESKQVQKEQQMKRNISELDKKLKYEIAQQNQKYFAKEIARIQKEIDKKIQTTLNQKNQILKKGIVSNTHSKINKKPENQQKPQPSSQKDYTSANNHSQSQQSQQNTIFESQTRQQLQELKQKVQELSDFRTELDKKFTENFNSLKGSWKDLGTELLDNKKLLNRKFEELSIDMIKLKNLAEFKPLPDTNDQSFKKKILQKFTDFYKMISSLTAKTEFEMVNDRTKTTMNRFSQQVLGLRQQFQKNTQYFTFYMNNSNSDDLKQLINKLKGDILEDKKYIDSMLADIIKETNQRKTSIENISKSIGALQMTNQTFEGKLKKITLNIERFDDKIKSLEDMNQIDPFKMKKIHQTLDLQLSFPNQEPSPSPKASSMPLKIAKQLKKEIELLKDQIFILSSEKNINGITEQDEILQLKNQIKLLNQKFQKLKIENDQVQLSRKPWIVMNSSERYKSVQKEPNLQKDQSKKKISIQIGKGGGFMNNRNSEKNIVYNMMNSTPQEKFEVYEKYREKYLSDTLKLPEIFKEKLNSDEFFK